VPKAGTAFERVGMESLEVINRRLARLKSLLPGKGISIKHESVEWSEVQAVLSRGDWKVGEAAAAAVADMERPTLAGWRAAMKTHGLDTDFYVHKTWHAKQDLPWEAAGE
jgi:hypothetical protein